MSVAEAGGLMTYADDRLHNPSPPSGWIEDLPTSKLSFVLGTQRRPRQQAAGPTFLTRSCQGHAAQPRLTCEVQLQDTGVAWDKRATETRLRGWGGRTRTEKCLGKLSL